VGSWGSITVPGVQKTYSEEVAGGDGESDGKRSGALHAGSVVVVSSSSEHDLESRFHHLLFEAPRNKLECLPLEK
jgi:hypothetical protein